MTDYTAMADSEINAAVAGRLGYVRFKARRGDEWCLPDPKLPVVGNVVCLVRDFKPATDLNAAWGLIAKLTALHFFVYSAATPGGLHDAFAHQETANFHASHTNPARAIAECFLQATDSEAHDER